MASSSRFRIPVARRRPQLSPPLPTSEPLFQYSLRQATDLVPVASSESADLVYVSNSSNRFLPSRASWGHGCEPVWLIAVASRICLRQARAITRLLPYSDQRSPTVSNGCHLSVKCKSHGLESGSSNESRIPSLKSSMHNIFLAVADAVRFYS